MKKIILFIILSVCFIPGFSQDDLDKFLDEPSDDKKVEYAEQTFKGNRLVNLHTVEVPGKRTLMYWIQHRFGYVNSGYKEFFGFDGGASIKMGLEYGINNDFSIGLERSNNQKQVELFGKYKFAKQTAKGYSMPFTMTGLLSINRNGIKDPTGKNFPEEYHRLNYVAQLMIARKINKKLSVQISPTYLHTNLVTTALDRNDLFSVPILARYKFSRSCAVTAEYNPQITAPSTVPGIMKTYYNGMAVGIDIETGGHVFQMFLTNCSPISVGQIMRNEGNTNGNPFKGDLRIGFNISRAFAL